VESTGQAKAEALSRAEAAKIEGEAAVEQAKLKAEALTIEAVSPTPAEAFSAAFAAVVFTLRLLLEERTYLPDMSSAGFKCTAALIRDLSYGMDNVQCGFTRHT